MVLYSCASGHLSLQSVGTACHHVINPGGYDGMGVGESTMQVIIAGIYECSEYLAVISGGFLRTNIQRKGDRPRITCGGGVSQK